MSAGQRKFNGLIRKIEKQRLVLQEWQTATPLYIETSGISSSLPGSSSFINAM